MVSENVEGVNEVEREDTWSGTIGVWSVVPARTLCWCCCALASELGWTMRVDRARGGARETERYTQRQGEGEGEGEGEGGER